MNKKEVIERVSSKHKALERSLGDLIKEYARLNYKVAYVFMLMEEFHRTVLTKSPGEILDMADALNMIVESVGPSDPEKHKIVKLLRETLSKMNK